MKRNFYLQHPLMAMHDPRMQDLFDKEGPRGTGAYWIIIEKLSILPAPRANWNIAPLLQEQKDAAQLPEENHLRIPTFSILKKTAFSAPKN